MQNHDDDDMFDDEPDDAKPAATDIAEPEAEQQKLTFKGLTETQKAKLRDQARKKVERQLRDKEAQVYLDAEVARLQADAGVGAKQAGGVLDDMVTFVCILDWEGSTHIQFDMPYGKKFFHGGRYTVPRHVYNELAFIMQAQRYQQTQFEGKSVFERKMRETVLGPSGQVSYLPVDERTVH